MFETWRHDNAALALVDRVSTIAAEAVDLDEALELALGEICAFSGWPIGHIVLAGQRALVGTTIWHGAEEACVQEFRRAGDTLRLGSGEGLPGRVLATGQPAWIVDVTDDATFVRRAQAADAGIHRALAYPLVAAGQVVGVLELFGDEPGKPGNELIALLDPLGRELARIVERSRALTRLQTSEERYRLLFEGASDPIFVGDADGVLTAVNPAACRLVGYSEEEMLGMNARTFCAPEWLDVVDREVAHKLSGEQDAASYEMVMVDRSGTRIPVDVRSNVLRDGADVIGIHAVIRDIRERKRVEIALRESEERFRAAFDAAAVGMALCSLDGRWIKVNDTLSHILGYSKDELLAMRWQTATHPDDLDADLALSESLLAGRLPAYQLDKRYLHKDGHPVWVHLSVSVVHAEDGTPAYAIAQIMELGERRRTEPASGAPCPLSPRERQVLDALAKGLKATETAAHLGIGEETVQTHVRRAITKLSARTRTHAVAKALRHGWLDQDPARDDDRPLRPDHEASP